MCPHVEPQEPEPVEQLHKRFSALDDPRVERTKRHRLLDIIAIAICAVIYGADDWVEIAEFGSEKREFFEGFLELPNGIPSHDTFGRVFARLDPEQFQACFLGWVQDLVSAGGGLLKGVVAIDGKTLCGSRDTGSGKGAIQMVSAWAQENRMVLGQVKVDDKSNEITAIPQLLKLFDLTGCTVTIDAMDAQKEIAKAITEKGADYVLSLKGNQGTMHRDVITMFDEAMACEFKGISHQTEQSIEKRHGRIETRHYFLVDDPAYMGYLNSNGAWTNLRGIGMVQSEREVGGGDGVRVVSKESRYYLCSVAGVAEFAKAARGHWSIENSLHWILDVAFAEDNNRTRTDHSAHNFAILRHIALRFLGFAQFRLKGEKTAKVGVKVKRLKAGWNEQYLLKVLLGPQPI